MSAVVAAASVGLGSIVLYAVLGGADFGGGVWDLLASGPRREQQRASITEAIGPVWEANHVWLIFAVVLLFTCFPTAFAALGSGLYVPLTFALIGIVLRGAAFVFRNYASDVPTVKTTWTAVFGVASLLAPFFLGDAVGALATGRFDWGSPFALSIGLFAVAVCAQIAAVFILREIPPGELREDFRRRAVRATLAVWLLGVVPGVIAAKSEPAVLEGLLRPSAAGAVGIAILAGAVLIGCILLRRDTIARVVVGVEAAAILVGWFGAQAPYIVPASYTYATAASSDAVIDAFLIVTAAGAVVLVPSLVLLFRVFKSAGSQ